MDEATAAINKVFSDTSVSPEETWNRMCGLAQIIAENLEALGAEGSMTSTSADGRMWSA